MRSEKELIQETMKKIRKASRIESKDFPDIDLYMDQVTTFMESRLASTRRDAEDKILTKTMINNYAKNQLLPSPEKKKYSRDHMMILMFIYYFKSTMYISDIQTVLTPLTEKYFRKEGDPLAGIYDEIFSSVVQRLPEIEKDICRDLSRALKSFPDADPEDQQFLQRFSMICMQVFDIYIRKMLVEQMIDDLSADLTDSHDRKKKKHKE